MNDVPELTGAEIIHRASLLRGILNDYLLAHAAASEFCVARRHILNPETRIDSLALTLKRHSEIQLCRLLNNPFGRF